MGNPLSEILPAVPAVVRDANQQVISLSPKMCPYCGSLLEASEWSSRGSALPKNQSVDFVFLQQSAEVTPIANIAGIATQKD